MYKLLPGLIAFAFYLLLVSPEVFACRDPRNQQSLFFDSIPEPPPEADVIAEVVLTDVHEGDVNGVAAATIVQILQAFSNRVFQHEKAIVKYKFSSCGPNAHNDDTGIIIAKIATDLEGRLVLCPYSRSLGHDSRIDVSSATKECQAIEVETLRQLELAAKQGDAKAQFELGKKYRQAKNGTEAVKWFKLAAAQSHAEAMLELGWIYDLGHLGVQEDATEAMKWYALAAEQGLYDAKVGLDTLKKMQVLTPMAEKGDAEAQYRLGTIYHGRRRDGPESLKWVKLAAEQGHVKAMSELGFMYRLGNGIVTQDFSESAKWYRLAAEQGDAEAQFSLGKLYDTGLFHDKGICPGRTTYGCVQSKVKAVEWYRRAAEQGVVDAQYALGVMYQKGDGVERNKTEAVKWLWLAAKQKDSYAIATLTKMYLEGQLGAKNGAEAEKWYRWAAKVGDKRAEEALESLEKQRSSRHFKSNQSPRAPQQ
ncbi:MAG: sel1 repeat family protein [Candidatus Adiutrix sp.]|jgi:TPR repeat protein|nr:sel1 repeat family protein [Candidatus Adiutrix sp.]